MAQCKQSAQEFIRDAFSPMVAGMCSHDAEQVCKKNNLTFVELIQPFCRLGTEAHVRDPGNISHTLQNFRVVVRDMSQLPPQPTLSKKILNDAVASAYIATDSSSSNCLSIGKYDLQLSASTPWFEAYRECFLQMAYPSEHEFTKHYLGCMFVVSSGNTDPMAQFHQMTQEQHQQQHLSPNKLPKWFCPNVLHYYVLIHDVTEAEQAKAEAIYQSMKSTYGLNNCHLLQINSCTPQSTQNSTPGSTPGSNSDTGAALPDPWAQFIQKKPNDFRDSDYDLANHVSDLTRLPDGFSSGDPLNKIIPTDPLVKSVEDAAEAFEEESVSHPLSVGTDNPLQSSTEQSYTDPHLPESSSTGQHGACLTVSDHDRLRIFVHEFIIRGLVPWAERTMRNLNDQISSRKGIHKSFLGATRRWFSGNKPQGQTTSTEKATVVYTPEAPEMQLRRLGDLAFMFQQYELAYQTYHTAKKDFNNDHAWLHFSGSLEMAALSVFLQGPTSQRSFPQHYLDSAISTYLTTCKSPLFATRATLLCTEACKSKGLYNETAMQYIKLTSEDSDLRSALLLEQAAHCYINSKQPMVRKYAFHMILAGHRFSKAAQRRHALRAYDQALQVYREREWTLAEDHINFTIGRQSFNIKQLDAATEALRNLVVRESKQSLPQQHSFLREYIFVYKQHLNESGESNKLPVLPLPHIKSNDIKVIVTGSKTHKDGSPIESSEKQWIQLEKLLVNKSIPNEAFKTTPQCFSRRSNNSSSPIAIQGEPVTLEIPLYNPLKVPLLLSDVTLLWKLLPIDYTREGENQEKLPEVVTNEVVSRGKSNVADQLVHTEVLNDITIPGNTTTQVTLCLEPQQTGELTITGLVYSLGSGQNSDKTGHQNNICVRGKQVLETQGPRLNATKLEKTTCMYGPDKRLDLIVAPPMPQLKVEFTEMPTTLLCGEVRHIPVTFTNCGAVDLHNLTVGAAQPKLVTFGAPSRDPENGTYKVTSKDFGTEFLHNGDAASYVMDIPIEGDVLKTGESVQVSMWLQGTKTSGVQDIDLLFFYQPTQQVPKLNYRLLRQRISVYTVGSLNLKCSALRSCSVTPGTRDLSSAIIALEVENANQIHDSTIAEFSILQVSCASQKWTLRHLSTQSNTDMKVCSHEKLHMLLKACQAKQKCDKEQLVFTNVTFDQHQIDSVASPCADFYLRSKAIKSLEEYMDEEPEQYSKEGSQIVDQGQKWDGLECTTQIGLSLIILWKAFLVDDMGKSRSVCGQHHLAVDTIGEEVLDTLQAKPAVFQKAVQFSKSIEQVVEAQPESNLLAEMLHCSATTPHSLVQHDFKKQRLCSVPVALTLQNCSACPLSVNVNTTASTRDEDKSTFPDQRLGAFTWVRQHSLTLKLSPNSSVTLPLAAGVGQPGVYNLAHIGVTARLDLECYHGDNIKQNVSMPTLLTVVQSKDG
ncbi:unnamed protein product [Owenia fusiformis]|uniref:Uncharacterized protein n=1 Tax=Owenia fusiformis TaxID=6347 RepID=A0A8J1USL7_OWEFU|nr:unnamed protein product [Owenia fusiformis]